MEERGLDRQYLRTYHFSIATIIAKSNKDLLSIDRYWLPIQKKEVHKAQRSLPDIWLHFTIPSIIIAKVSKNKGVKFNWYKKSSLKSFSRFSILTNSCTKLVKVLKSTRAHGLNNPLRPPTMTIINSYFTNHVFFFSFSPTSEKIGCHFRF